MKLRIHFSLLRFLSLTLLLLLTIPQLSAQVYKFRKYQIDDGLCHPFIYSIEQDKNGFIWAATGQGLCRFDGLSFSSSLNGEELSESFVASSFRDADNNLWFGHNDGAISYYDGYFFKNVSMDAANSIINAFFADENGNVFAVSQNDGLIKINKNFEIEVFKEPFENKLLYSGKYVNGNNLLIGTNRGLDLYIMNTTDNTLVYQQSISEIPDGRISKIYQVDDSKYIIGTSREGIYALNYTGVNEAGFEIEEVLPEFNMNDVDIQSIFIDKNLNLWVSTFGNGLYKFLYSSEKEGYSGYTNYNTQNGLGNNFIKGVYQDWEGNIWIGTYGNGLAFLPNEEFVFYNFEEEVMGRNVLSVEFYSGNYWLGGENGLIKVPALDPDNTSFFGIRQGLPADDITSIYADGKNNLWIGTKRNGIYRMDTRTERLSRYFYSQNSLENNINHLTGLDNYVYAATNSGVIILNIANGEKQILNTSDGLHHNLIHHLFIDSRGRAWIATRSDGLYNLMDNMNYRIDNQYELEFSTIIEDKDGHLWAGTLGDGLFKFEQDSLYHFSTPNGLRTNYCYSLSLDKEGNIWVGHRLAMSRVNIHNNSVVSFGVNMGITGDCNPNATLSLDDGALLMGTTDGLLRYESRKLDSMAIAPVLNISSVRVNDEEIDFHEPIVLSYGTYRIRIEYVGLHYKSPDKVTYKYMLEGFDNEYMETTTSRYALYSNLKDGQYIFNLKACDGEGNCSIVPLSLNIKIQLPFWKKWWFILLTIGFLVFSVYSIIKYRERKLIAFQKMLEQKLDERTREVVSQKEEIELKNRDITDSINYAQRIQASILPSFKKLQENFSGSFVFYQPRDIVSGDFYWFDTITENRFIIVCADSTGHGVPGAFMSMIGTTLIKDICMRPDVNSPSDILCMLDKEIHSTLNQNLDAEKSNDGMDIIVCEIDVTTYFMRLASAMRPIILYQNGEQVYVPGSRSSIGGGFEDKVVKKFEDKTFQLSKGDLVYMFSDGYPDQFGGPLGKKFKMVRLKNLLRDIHTKPMEEQYTHVKNNFNIWKEDFDQIDDVLFMGIKI